MKKGLFNSSKSKINSTYEELKLSSNKKIWNLNDENFDDSQNHETGDVIIKNQNEKKHHKTTDNTEPSKNNEDFKSSKNEKMERLLGLNSYHCPLDNRGSVDTNQSMNCIRALSDLFTCPVTSYPISVGIFDRIDNEMDIFDGKENKFLIKLINGIQKVAQIEKKNSLDISILLFLYPSVTTLILGYIVSIFANWKIGLIVGSCSVVLQYSLLGLLLSKIVENQYVISFINSMLQTISLFLHVLFCNAIRPKISPTKLKVITVYHMVEADESGQIVLSVVEKLWKGLVKNFGFYVVRLQSVCNTKESGTGPFKKICCFPSFAVFIAWTVALLSLIFMVNQLIDDFATKVNLYRNYLPIFVIVCAVSFLGTIGCAPIFYKIIKAFFVSPTRSLHAASKKYVRFKTSADITQNATSNISLMGSSTPIVDIELGTGGQKRKQVYIKSLFKYLYSTSKSKAAACNADMLSKSEFQKACQLVTDFDCFLKQKQTRIVLCIDATGMQNREGLAKLIYRMHSLLLSDPEAPVAVVIHANYQLLIGDMITSKENPESLCQSLSDSYHLVHTSLHLPIYLDSLNDSKMQMKNFGTFTPNNSSLINKILKSNVIHQANIDQEKEKSLLNLASETMESTVVAKPIKRVTGIAELFLDGSELTDLNLKIIKKLVAVTAFTSRLLRLNHINMNTKQLVKWVTLVEHWPFHIIYLTTVLNDISRGLSRNEIRSKSSGNMPIEDSELDLQTLISLIQSNLGKLPHYVSCLMADDKDPEKLLSYIKSDQSRIFTLSDMKKLLSTTLFINPFIKIILENQLNQTEPLQPLRYIGFEKNMESQDATSSDLLSNEEVANSTNEHAPLVKSKSEHSSYKLSQLNIEQVCLLMEFITSIPQGNLEKYKTKIIEHNITGLVLSVCDLEQLRQELSMTYGDWELLRNHILQLRQQEGTSKTNKFKNPLEMSLSMTPLKGTGSSVKSLVKNQKYYDGTNIEEEMMKHTSKSRQHTPTHSRERISSNSKNIFANPDYSEPYEDWTSSEDEEEDEIDNSELVTESEQNTDGCYNSEDFVCDSVDEVTCSRSKSRLDRYNLSGKSTLVEVPWDYEIEKQRSSTKKQRPSRHMESHDEVFDYPVKSRNSTTLINQCTCDGIYKQKNQSTTSPQTSSNESINYTDQSLSFDEIKNSRGSSLQSKKTHQSHTSRNLISIKDCEV